MKHNDDFIGKLEDYLEEFDGVTPLPDRVREAIRAELPSAWQVRPQPGPLRMFTMLSSKSTGARVGLAAAAVIVTVVLGAAFINTDLRGGGVGAAATPTPTPTPGPTSTPTPVPSVAAQPLTLGVAPTAPCDPTDTAKSCLAPGTYRLTGDDFRAWPVTVTIHVPAGWFEWQANPGFDGVLVDGGPEARGNSGWGVMFATVGDVSRDPCDPMKGVIPGAQVNTPQKLATAMAAWPGFTATATEPITVDGHDGLKLQLTWTGPGGCSTVGPLWRTTLGGDVNAYPMIASGGGSAPGTYEIVDTDRGLLVIRTTDFPQTSPNEVAGGVTMDPTRHAADQVVLHAILDSIRLSIQPASS